VLEAGLQKGPSNKISDLRELIRRVHQLKDDIAECFKIRMESSLFFTSFEIVFFSFSYSIFFQVPTYNPALVIGLPQN